MKYVDLTLTMGNNLPNFPGDKKFKITKTSTLEKDGVELESFTSSTHSGTHIDAPGHFTTNKKSILEISVESFFNKAICINVNNESVIKTAHLKELDQDISAILFYTGFEEKINQDEYFKYYPEIDFKFAQFIVDKKIKIIGIDSPSVDKIPFKVHKLLLKNDILIIENLINLKKLCDLKSFELISLPLKIDAFGSPARVIAKIE